MTRQRYWCCPGCGLVCTASQSQCGNCGEAQSSDAADLEPGDVLEVMRDAEVLRRRQRKKKG